MSNVSRRGFIGALAGIAAAVQAKLSASQKSVVDPCVVTPEELANQSREEAIVSYERSQLVVDDAGANEKFDSAIAQKRFDEYSAWIKRAQCEEERIRAAVLEVKQQEYEYELRLDREWIERMAKLEEECGDITVGGGGAALDLKLADIPQWTDADRAERFAVQIGMDEVPHVSRDDCDSFFRAVAPHERDIRLSGTPRSAERCHAVIRDRRCPKQAVFGGNGRCYFHGGRRAGKSMILTKAESNA